MAFDSPLSSLPILPVEGGKGKSRELGWKGRLAGRRISESLKFFPLPSKLGAREEEAPLFSRGRQAGRSSCFSPNLHLNELLSPAPFSALDANKGAERGPFVVPPVYLSIDVLAGGEAVRRRNYNSHAEDSFFPLSLSKHGTRRQMNPKGGIQ